MGNQLLFLYQLKFKKLGWFKDVWQTHLGDRKTWYDTPNQSDKNDQLRDSRMLFSDRTHLLQCYAHTLGHIFEWKLRCAGLPLKNDLIKACSAISVDENICPSCF
jgi:hypothetical protein